jgi:hypothetical protein
MKSKTLTRQQEKIFKLVSDFENRRLEGEKITIEAYLKEVKDKTTIDGQLLREYLESSDLALKAGKEKSVKTPKLSPKDIADIQSKLQGLLKEKQHPRLIEQPGRMRGIGIAASPRRKPKKK